MIGRGSSVSHIWSALDLLVSGNKSSGGIVVTGVLGSHFSMFVRLDCDLSSVATKMFMTAWILFFNIVTSRSRSNYLGLGAKPEMLGEEQ